jgi:23S rRNA (cytosine1962-C5)-methyltransferase
VSRIATLKLRGGRDKSLLRKHPWVFSGGVDRLQGSAEAGETVMVRSAEGRFLAWAAYSPASQIVARAWSFDENDTVDAAFIERRLAAAIARRAPLSERTNATRLVFSESDGLPGLIVDRYDATVVIEITSTGADSWRDVIADHLEAQPGVERVYERSDIDVRDREGLPRRAGLLRGSEPPEVVEIHEDGARFLVDVRNGHKTGFYLDQRESRAAVARLAAGRRVLNVFAYTGAFSVVAGRNGATGTTSVDSSAPSLATAARNLELNGCAPGEMITADAFAELRRLRERGERFDLVILDPPKLVHGAKSLDRSTRAYKDLSMIGAQLLNPGGLLIPFSCSGLMTEDLFQKVVAGAVLDAGRDARIIGRLHQASDHPVHLAVPETAYLKGLICQLS